MVEIFVSLLLITVASHAVLGRSHAINAYPFQNISLSFEERVNDLVYRLTLQEMVDQMAYGGGGPSKPVPAIPRLGIPAYQFDTECLRGLLNAKSTAFPQSIGLSASFSEEMMYYVAEAISTEVRAFNNYAVAHGDYSPMRGLSCFAPFINLARHPLWGRNQEVYGEDPYLSGILSAGYVRGLHGNHPRYVRVSSGCKVVGLYSGPENIPVSRLKFNAVASERDMRLSYMPPFRACIEAGTFNLMCSYYRVNGIPGCTHKWLLTDVMRNEYGFKGYYVTDCGALNVAVYGHHYFNDSLYAAAAAANAGVSLECPDNPPSLLRLTEAIEKGLVSLDTIVERVKPLFYTRMRLGDFDPPEANPYRSIDMTVVESAAHRELAIVAATKTFVLIKNDAARLPLNGKINTLTILGPMADNLGDLYGDYSPTIYPEFASTPLKGLQSLAKSVLYEPGCDNVLCLKYNATAVKQAAAASDVVIVCLGTGVDVETEGGDRANLDLPGHQSNLLLDAMASAKQPVILLLFTGGPFNISGVKMSSQLGAILQCFYPAQSTGAALLRVLAIDASGHVFSPSARLPYTWPASLDQVPPMIDYSMEGRTYRYFKGVPLYPFGYGLSYSNFAYSNLVISPPVAKAGTNVTVSVTVTNLGSFDSDEVVQVYISWLNCPVAMPQRQLVAVRRTPTAANHALTLNLTIHAQQMMIWDDKQGFIFYPGTIDVFVGGQQPNQATSISSNVLHGQFQISTASEQEPENANKLKWNDPFSRRMHAVSPLKKSPRRL